VDVFALSPEARAALLGAARAAAVELRLVEALAVPRTVDELAAALAVAPRRLRALVDVLVLDGALGRDGARLRPGRLETTAPMVAAGWGQLAEVIRRDRPLDETEAFADPDEQRRRYHAYLATAGAAAARELAARLATEPAAAAGLLDLGGGAGAYTDAFLDARPDAPATLVDRAAVLPLAAARLGARARLVAGELDDETLEIGAGHGVALLCNVLHFFAPAACQRLIERAARAVAPGGEVVVKDLHIEPDRSGPAVGLLFALNMALYSDAGDVHDPREIAAWLDGAGLADVRVETLYAAPDHRVVRGRRR
jgi:hypothetical protein